MDNFPMEVEVKVNGVICHIDRVEGDWYRDNDRTVWTYCRIATTPVKVDKSADAARRVLDVVAARDALVEADIKGGA